MSAERDLENPYVGPRPFERNEQDSLRFFGRARETQEIVSLIFGHPLLLVYAQSGAGKTSLFNASITTTLEGEGFEVLPLTRVRGVIPDNFHLEQIKNPYVFNALLNVDTNAEPQALVTETLASFLNARPRANDDTGEPVPRVLVFDQFEELFNFTPHGYLELRDGFFEQVTEALQSDPLLRVVFIIREDFLAQLDPYARLLPERLRTRYRLERLQAAAALHAIKDPIRGTKRSFEPGAAERLVKDLLVTRTVDAAGEMAEVEGQYVEPVQLQVVCLTLWSDLPPDTTVITQRRVEGFDVNRALSNFYRTAVQAVVKDTGLEEAALREWFGRTLITPMETRSTVYRGETSTGGIPNNVVDALESRHLIRAEYRAGVRWYELTHDRFIEAILDDNEEWYASRRETLGNPITAAAKDWQRLGEDQGSLLRGALLKEATEWARNHSREMDDLERSFLNASQLRHQRELEQNAKTARTLLNLTVALVLVAILALGAAGRAVQQSNAANSAAATSQSAASTAGAAEVAANLDQLRAEQEAEKAREAQAEARSGQLALQSITALDTDPQLSLLLAIEAVNERHTFEADDALRQALDASRVRAVLSGHSGRLTALAFVSDGEFIVTGGADGTTRIWDTKTGSQMVQLGGSGAGIVAIVYDPKSGLLATGTTEGLVVIWDVTDAILAGQTGGDATPLAELEGHEGSIIAMVFSSDGRWLATTGVDGTARLWDMEIGKDIFVFEHADAVTALAISPNGDLLATASITGEVNLWDTESGTALSLLGGQKSAINAMAFSPDARLLVTAGADGIAHVWDAINGAEVATLTGHYGGIVSIAFSPDGDFLATAGEDTSARLWEMENYTEAADLRGHSDRITAVTFSQDGQLLATASADGTARVWSVPDGALRSVFEGHSSSVNVIAFSPEGEVLATASSDGTARLWEVASEDVQRILRGQGGIVYDVEFNREGNLLVTFGEDSAMLWDFAKTLTSEGDDQGRTSLEGYGGFGFGMEFSPDGSILALSSLDEENQTGTLDLLDVSALPERKIIDSQTFPGQLAFNMEFAPDQSLLAISAINPEFGYTTLRLWDFAAGTTKDITFQNMIIVGLAFSHDGTLLVISGGNEDGDNGTIEVWDVSRLRNGDIDPEVAVIRGPVPFLRVAFTADGNTLVSGTFDGTIRLWDFSELVNNGDSVEEAVLGGHESEVWGLALSSDGSLLAGGEGDGSVRLWDVAAALETGGINAERSILRGHSGVVYGVTFSPDGSWLVTASDDETVRLWPVDPAELKLLACRNVNRNLTLVEWDTYLNGNVDNYRRTCDNAPYHESVLDAMVDQGRDFVNAGYYDLAVDKWQEVNELDPKAELKPDEMLVDALENAVGEHLDFGEYGRAMQALEKYSELAPDFSSVAEDWARTIVDTVSSQESFSSGDQVEQARAALARAVELDPNVPPEDLAEAYHGICRFGSLDGYAKSALPACQRAVVLAGENDMDYEIGLIHDSRGLARALIGDLPGAVTDFKFFLEWAEDNFVSEEIVPKRQAWIDLLEEGRNPFMENPALLQEIRDE